MVRNKAALAKNFHIQPSEFEVMPYWEYELFIENLNEMIKEDNERNKSEEEGYNKYKNFKPDSYKPPKMPGYSAPKMPKMPSL